MASKEDNRIERETVVRNLNELAGELGVEAVNVRAKTEAIERLYKDLCKKVPSDKDGRKERREHSGC